MYKSVEWNIIDKVEKMILIMHYLYVEKVDFM
jgi:hypothetical protein